MIKETHKNWKNEEDSGEPILEGYIVVITAVICAVIILYKIYIWIPANKFYKTHIVPSIQKIEKSIR